MSKTDHKFNHTISFSEALQQLFSRHPVQGVHSLGLNLSSVAHSGCFPYTLASLIIDQLWPWKNKNMDWAKISGTLFLWSSIPQGVKPSAELIFGKPGCPSLRLLECASVEALGILQKKETSNPLACEGLEHTFNFLNFQHSCNWEVGQPVKSCDRSNVYLHDAK